MPKSDSDRMKEIVVGIKHNHKTSTFQGCVTNNRIPKERHDKGELMSSQVQKNNATTKPTNAKLGESIGMQSIYDV